jgi:hypothetical protein
LEEDVAVRTETRGKLFRRAKDAKVFAIRDVPLGSKALRL